MITKRSIVIDGVVTSISMECAFWEEVDARAGRNGLSWQEYVRRLLSGIHDVPNRSSALRETILRQLQVDCIKSVRTCFETWWRITGFSGSREIGLRVDRFIVGRGGEGDIVLDDSGVSRKHLLVAFDGEDWWVIDLESKNGTWVDGKRIHAARLAVGSKIILGNSELFFLG